MIPLQHFLLGTFSIVLLAVCDANYKFTAVDVGAYGSQSDGGVLHHSEFGKRLIADSLDLPESTPLTNSGIHFPYFFVRDAAFPLRHNLMRPYPGVLLSQDRQLFNMRLSRARRTIENAFGIMTARWRILLGPLHMSPRSAETVVKAILVLHNFLRVNEEKYCPPEFVDSYQGETLVEGTWRSEAIPLSKLGRSHSNNATKRAFHLRDVLKIYITGN